MAKKKYAIEWDDDLPVSFTVNGVTYKRLDDIPDATDRRKLEAMLNSAEDAEFDPQFNAEIAKAHKELEQISAFPVEKVILGVFTGIAILMLLIAGITSYNNIRKVDRERSVSGKVVDMITRQQYGDENPNEVIGEAYFPVVEFVINDKRYIVELNEGSNPPFYEVGDEVTILYEPENLQDARIKSAGSSALMWILPSITGILGIGFLVAVIAVRKVMAEDNQA